MKLIDDAYFEFYLGHVKGHIRKEHGEQVDAISYTRFNHPGVIVFHVPNEGNVPVQYREKLIEAGLLKGVSDNVILVARGGYHGALIELKRATKSKSSVSPEQVEFLRACRKEGYFTAVAFGALAYQKALDYYLAL